MTAVLVIGLGLLAGIFSIILGIGGGIILVPGMVYLLGMEMHKAVGTSLVIIIPTALMGVYRHSLMGNIEWKSSLLIIAGSITGAYIGGWVANYLPGDIMKKVFAIFLVLMAFKMWKG